MDLPKCKSEIHVPNANIQQQNNDKNHNSIKVLSNEDENVIFQGENAVDKRSDFTFDKPTNSTSNSKNDNYKYALIKSNIMLMYFIGKENFEMTKEMKQAFPIPTFKSKNKKKLNERNIPPVSTVDNLLELLKKK